MVGVEERLTTELKKTMLPSVLTKDMFFKNIECPYCREEDPQDMFYNNGIFIYVDPRGYLRFGSFDGVGTIDIMFCPMCGKSLS